MFIKVPYFKLSLSSELPSELLTMPRSFIEKLNKQNTEGRDLLRLKEN